MKEQLQTHLQQIVRDRNPYLASAGYFYVQQYIRQQLEQWGTVTAQPFQVRGQTHTNFILDLPGQRSKPPILIGAHYDTVPGTPGADDNGTGVAALLWLAEQLATEPARHPVRLVAFDLEEYGLSGSRYYVQQLQPGEPLRLMLSLEMLGYCDRSPQSQRYPAGLERFYPDRGDFIALIGNVQALPDLLRLSGQMRRSGTGCEWLPAGKQGRIVPDTRRSDHAPFWDAGYRAILVTDTADLRSPHYHQPSDRLETLDLDFFAGVCRGLAQGIRHL